MQCDITTEIKLRETGTGPLYDEHRGRRGGDPGGGCPILPSVPAAALSLLRYFGLVSVLLRGCFVIVR